MKSISFDETKLTSKTFQTFRKLKIKKETDYLKTVFSDLRIALKLTQTKLSNFLREELNLSQQEVGNCAWANQHGIVEVYTALEKAKNDILNPLERNLVEIKKGMDLAKKEFKISTHLFKMNYFNKYLAFHVNQLKSKTTEPNPILIAVCLGKLMEEKKLLANTADI